MDFEIKPVTYAKEYKKEEIMTAKELCDLFHYPSPLMNWKCGCSLYDEYPYDIQFKLYALADAAVSKAKEPKKHLIFISVPTHASIVRHIDDLRIVLDKTELTKTMRVNYREGWLETNHVRASMIPENMNRLGLRCDACFGFEPGVALRLNPNASTIYSSLMNVPRYIFNIEYQKLRKEETKMAISNVSAAFTAISTSLNSKPTIKNVIFNDPATIVMWSDGTKTVVKAENEPFDPEKGLAMAISKKNLGNKYDYYNTFKHWIKKYNKEHPEKDAAWEVPAKPVQAAYKALINIMSTKGTKLNTKPALEEAIEEAIGFLGEALDD